MLTRLPCCSEVLESRILFAGNVTTDVDGDDLFIRGDGAGNKITVTGGLGFFRVEPRGSTTLNGNDNDEDFQLEGIDHIRIFLKGGKDTVQIDALTISEELVIKTGSKRDEITMTDVNVGSNLTIDAVSADDIITMDDVSVGDNTHIDLDAGDDNLLINDSTFSDAFTARGKDGNDIITIDDDTVIDGPKTITGGPGADDITDESSDD